MPPKDPRDEEIARLQRSLAEAEARARDLSVINSFAATLLHYQTDVDDILWDLANQAVARLGLEDCVIYGVNDERTHLLQRAAYGPKNPRGREILSPIYIPWGQGVVGAAAATGRPQRIADTRLDPRYICDDQMRLSELAVPMFHEGQVVGVIDSEHSKAGFFTAWHQDVFTTLASMAAARIARARLDEQLRALNGQLEEKVRQRTAELAEAHRRSENLLTNVLPVEIAARLKAGETRIADRADEVAVLFADVVGFTRFAAGAPPEQVVELLDTFFTRFEQLAVVYGAEKIKTIGDAIMLVMGAPRPAQDAAGRLAELALALRDAVPGIRRSVRAPLEVRFGLHAGPAVAGVIGRNKFAYDLWGDTVNMAARLEAHGEPGRIQVTEALAARLDGRFQFTPARRVELKGMGLVPTRFLVSRR